jgi:hypothetical protein
MSILKHLVNLVHQLSKKSSAFRGSYYTIGTPIAAGRSECRMLNNERTSSAKTTA